MKPAKVIAISFEWVWYGSLWICSHSQKTIAITPKFSPILYQTKFYCQMMLQFHLHATALLFILFSMFMGRCITVWPKSLSVNGWHPATLTPGKTVDSDRLQLWPPLWLHSPGRHHQGDASLGSKFQGDVHPEIVFFKENLAIFAKTFGFSSIFKIKWAKSEEKSEFWGRWFWLTRIRPSSQDLSRQSKICGDAPLIDCDRTDFHTDKLGNMGSATG